MSQIIETPITAPANWAREFPADAPPLSIDQHVRRQLLIQAQNGIDTLSIDKKGLKDRQILGGHKQNVNVTPAMLVKLFGFYCTNKGIARHFTLTVKKGFLFKAQPSNVALSASLVSWRSWADDKGKLATANESVEMDA